VGWLGQQACWTSRPDGPDWFCQLFQKQNFKFKFKGYFLLAFKPSSKNSNNTNKTLSYSLMT
jgi:hypothetical protein